MSDEAHRSRILTDLNSTLLVEAAAGTGKTSLLAGRVLCLLAAGTPPREIAAITFTEFAAGELRQRVSGYLEELLGRYVRKELRLAFPQGVGDAQHEALLQARTRMDELTCTTIHGFCHDLLRRHAVEAGIDPGAEILDDAQGDLIFRSIFEQWLRERLDRDVAADDPIAVMARIDPTGSEGLLRRLAEVRREHRAARTIEVNLGTRADTEFVECVAEFRRWFELVQAPSGAEADINQFEQLAEHFRGQFDPLPGFEMLWRLAHPERVDIMRKHHFNLLSFQRRGVWKRAVNPADGKRWAEEATAHYGSCAESFCQLMGNLATALVSGFSAELDELLALFERFKRNAAVIDFDDLLYLTRQMLRDNKAVREASARRFSRILIDEFQDTDPIQAEIVFLLAGEGDLQKPWHERRLQPGRLFMVGDPRQAIYRFRGADIATYRLARDAVAQQFPGNVVHVSSNFRSAEEILRHVNRCFEAPLAAQATGYVPLESTRPEAGHGLPCVTKIKVNAVHGAYVDEVRDEEARAVAECCGRLIGNVKICHGEEPPRFLLPGDIALLTPSRTELWRYERALEEAGLPFSSQAGKNLFRRQEVQDLVALVRTIVDSRDTLAMGALLRGPLVGLTEQELLDIALSLPQEKSGLMAGLSLWTDPACIAHPVARHALEIMRDLWRRMRTTTPSLLIAEAVERLNARAILSARGPDQASRALANIDAVIERARAYGVRGFRQFVLDLDRDWSRRAFHSEGVVDAERQSIEIVTIHSSKGLEWPVVVPINAVSAQKPLEKFVHRRADETLHWKLGDILPPSLAEAIHTEEEEETQQRVRLLYVACTRAMDMLVLPELPSRDASTWSGAIDHGLSGIQELNVAGFSQKPLPQTEDRPNGQTRAIFETEQTRIAQTSEPVRWIRPSDSDPDIIAFEMTGLTEGDQPVEEAAFAIGGSFRGIILHKLMEELVGGELETDLGRVRQRASLLVEQLASLGQARADIDPQELASTALRTFALPALALGQGNVIAEVPVYARVGGDGNRLVSGRADAVRYKDDRAEIVFDWKSDVAPEPSARQSHARQLALYVRALGAEKGAVVYMTSGEIEWVAPKEARS